MNRDDIRTREFPGLMLEFSAPTEVELREGEDGQEDHLYGRIVPYNSPTPIGRDVEEVFLPGSLDKTLRENPKGIKLYSTHDTRSRQPIGSVRAHDSREDGMYVRFSLNRTNDGNDVRELVRTGDATGLSVGFIPLPKRSYDTESGGVTTIYRQEALLDHVAFVARPAYPGAQVGSVRDQPLIESEEVLAAYSEELTDEPPPHKNEPEGTPLLDEWQEYLASED